MATFLFVTIPLTIGYFEIGKKIIKPVIDGIIEGTKDGIRDIKAMNKQAEETKE